MNEPKHPKPNKGLHEVTFYTYPNLVFTWPIIVMGFLLWPIDKLGWVYPEVLAWFWGITILLVLITMGVDLNRNYAIFWLAVVLGSWTLVLWLRDAKHITIFGYIYRFFADLDPTYSRNLGLIVSIPLTILWGIMWVWTRLNSKWRITHNELEHYQFGRMDDSLARGAKRIRTTYPDLFELLICLAGDLEIYDATGKKLLRRIEHVPLLPIVKKKINILLESTAVTQEEVVDEEATAAESEVSAEEPETPASDPSEDESKDNTPTPDAG
jgi:hypothetical protein